MTPKEKAEELYDWFLNEGKDSYGRYQSSEVEDLEGAKFCALKTVDEILKVAFYAMDEIYEYYIEVKKEIELL